MYLVFKGVFLKIYHSDEFEFLDSLFNKGGEDNSLHTKIFTKFEFLDSSDRKIQKSKEVSKKRLFDNFKSAIVK